MRRSRFLKEGLAVVYHRRQGRITSLEVHGHAGFASLGNDIVCAAVSALVLSAAEGLRTHCNAKVSVSDAPSVYRLKVGAGSDERAQAVLETTLDGLNAIAAAYPGHVVVEGAKAGATKDRRTGQRSPREKSAVRPR